MNVRVLFFGSLKEICGIAPETVSLPDDSTLSVLLEQFRSSKPELQQFLPSIAVSVNLEYANENTRLKDGDEVAFLPPVSGGSIDTDRRRCWIVREKIDTHRLLETTKGSSDGAVVIFEGVVRDNTRGRRTLYLDYEAYEEMALRQMEALCERALIDFAIRDVKIVHRLGRLEIGETSVLIVVASAHRGAAFDASRWLMDTLKREVPIWKKERFEDGAVWADGEAFPAGITVAKAPIE
jgi:molybdopterin converting factor subunit 1